MTDSLNNVTLHGFTNKLVYKEFMASLNPPKVVMESGKEYGQVWRRLQSGVVDEKARDILFLLLHNKLPVPERLFRIKLLRDPYCQKCTGALISDLEHLFCCCSKTEHLWLWLTSKLSTFDVKLSRVSNWDLINLFYCRTPYDEEVTWLIANYVHFVWERTFVQEVSVNLNAFFGFLTFKYRENLNSMRLRKLDEFK